MNNWCESHVKLESNISDIKESLGDIKGDIGEMRGLMDSGALVTSKYLHSELQKVYGRIYTIVGGLSIAVLALSGALIYIMKTI